MKKKLAATVVGIGLALAGCGSTEIVETDSEPEQIEGTYLIAATTDLKQVSNLGNGKCQIQLRGKHTVGDITPERLNDKENIRKNTLNEAGKKELIKCIDGFNEIQLSNLEKEKEVVFIQRTGQ